MKIYTLKKRWAFAVSVLVLTLISCNLLTTSVNQVRNESQTVDLKNATSARVQINFPAGDLTVQGGAQSLMDASFQYNVDKWKPQVQYSENGAQGELNVSQPGSDQVPVGGRLINTWKLLLENDTPIDLSIQTGAGNSDLNLGDLDLTTVKIDSGTGTMDINLAGNWNHDVNVSIHGGVGQLKVKLPSEIGVHIEMETALVNVKANGLIVADKGYVNQAYGTSPHTLTLKLEAGVGSVILTVSQ
jgi:hypothetical protein